MSLDLPELQDAMLDDTSLGLLLSDLSEHAEVLEIRTKGGATATAEQVSDLTSAASLLKAGAVRAIQLTYVFDGEVWTDTLMRTPAGVRLVRMAAPVLKE